MNSSQSNWIALCALVLATILILKGHPTEATAIVTGAFGVLHVERSQP